MATIQLTKQAVEHHFNVYLKHVLSEKTYNKNDVAIAATIAATMWDNRIVMRFVRLQALENLIVTPTFTLLMFCNLIHFSDSNGAKSNYFNAEYVVLSDEFLNICTGQWAEKTFKI